MTEEPLDPLAGAALAAYDLPVTGVRPIRRTSNAMDRIRHCLALA